MVSHGPCSQKVVLEAVSHKCFQIKWSKKPVRRKKKKIRRGGQNLKDHWPLAWRFVKQMKYIKRNSWRDHQKLKLKLFILPVSENINILFTFTLHILTPFSMGAGKKAPYQLSSVTSTNVEISPWNFLTFNFNSFATPGVKFLGHT